MKKHTTKYRVMVGNKGCSLNRDFHELGIVLPDTDRAGAHIFDTRVLANNCIARLFEAKQKAQDSLYPEFKGFKCLFFDGIPQVEEFQVELEN